MSDADATDYLYVYCIIPSDSGLADFGVSDIDGRGDRVYTVAQKDILAVVSGARLRRYERNEENIMAHQRVIQRVLNRCRAVPMPFSTILKDTTDVQKILESRYEEFTQKLSALSAVGEQGVEDPGRQLVEEALAQSFGNALRIRELNEKLSYLNSITNGNGNNGILAEKLLEEVHALREKVTTIDSMCNSITEAVRSIGEELKSIRRWNGDNFDLTKLEKDVHNSKVKSIINGLIDQAKATQLHRIGLEGRSEVKPGPPMVEPLGLSDKVHQEDFRRMNGSGLKRENHKRYPRRRPKSAEE